MTRPVGDKSGSGETKEPIGANGRTYIENHTKLINESFILKVVQVTFVFEVY
jgi:hypothetical protein